MRICYFSGSCDIVAWNLQHFAAIRTGMVIFLLWYLANDEFSTAWDKNFNTLKTRYWFQPMTVKRMAENPHCSIGDLIRANLPELKRLISRHQRWYLHFRPTGPTESRVALFISTANIWNLPGGHGLTHRTGVATFWLLRGVWYHSRSNCLRR